MEVCEGRVKTAGCRRWPALGMGHTKLDWEYGPGMPGTCGTFVSPKGKSVGSPCPVPLMSPLVTRASFSLSRGWESFDSVSVPGIRPPLLCIAPDDGCP